MAKPRTELELDLADAVAELEKLRAETQEAFFLEHGREPSHLRREMMEKDCARRMAALSMALRSIRRAP